MPTPGTSPATFVPELVRECRLVDDGAADVPEGCHGVSEETSPVTARLVASPALPDQELDPRDHGACAGVATSPVHLLLVDSGRHAFRPYLPEDPCGSPRQEVRAAIDAVGPTKIVTDTVPG